MLTSKSELPYENLQPSKWLPRYYEVSAILNKFLDHELEDFLGEELAGAARKHIDALNREITAEVREKVAAHHKVFTDRPADEQARLKAAAEAATARPRVNESTHACPSCGAKGILEGDHVRDLLPIYKDEQLLVEQTYLASSFECLACNLTLKGLAELRAAYVEAQFTRLSKTSLHDLYEPEFGYEYDNM